MEEEDTDMDDSCADGFVVPNGYISDDEGVGSVQQDLNELCADLEGAHWPSLCHFTTCIGCLCFTPPDLMSTAKMRLHYALWREPSIACQRSHARQSSQTAFSEGWSSFLKMTCRIWQNTMHHRK